MKSSWITQAVSPMRGVLIRARREDRIEDHMKTGVNVWGEVATK